MLIWSAFYLVSFIYSMQIRVNGRRLKSDEKLFFDCTKSARFSPSVIPSVRPSICSFTQPQIPSPPSILPSPPSNSFTTLKFHHHPQFCLHHPQIPSPPSMTPSPPYNFIAQFLYQARFCLHHPQKIHT